MSLTVFEKNLESLRRRYPEYAAAIQRAPVAAAPFIDSDRVREWLRKAFDARKRQAVLLGMAGGRAVRILQDELNPYLLIVVERSVRHLAAAMREIDLCDVFEDECVHWSIGCPPQRLDEGLAFVKSALAANGFQVIRTPINDPAATGYYDAILKELPGVVEREAVSLKALMARGTGVQVNLARNFPTVMDSCYPDSVLNLFRKKPAIVVAAGPSLDKNVERLVSLNDRAVLLCVDTAVKTLLPLGIKTHFVVTSDPTPENARHFDGVSLSAETVFAYAPDCCPEALERYREAPRKLCLFDESNWYNERLRELLNLRTLLPRPMHVGEAAIRLAIAMGCDPIVLVGLDLALPNDARATHAKASARSLAIVSKNGDRIEVRGEGGDVKAQDLVPVPGIGGETVFTYHSFKMYLDDLERIASSTPVRWIDATEGGALKRGCALQSLEETLAQLGETLDIAGRVQKMTAPSRETAASCVAQMERDFKRLGELGSGLQRVSRGEAEYDEAARLWGEFINDKNLRAFIDHAAYPFQLLPRLNKLQREERMDFLGAHSGRAANAISTLSVFWNDAFQRCGRKENVS